MRLARLALLGIFLVGAGVTTYVIYLSLSSPRLQPAIETQPNLNWSVTQLVEALDSPSSRVQLLALTYLQQRGNTLRNYAPEMAQSIPKLIDIVSSSPSVDTRVTAMSVLGFIGPDAKLAVPVLVDALDAAHTRDDRLAAAGVLGSIGPKATDAVPSLTEMLAMDEDDVVRGAAAFSLGRISSDAVTLNVLIQQIQQEHEGEALMGIAKGLCSMGATAKPAIPALAEKLWWPSPHGVKQSAAKAISNIANVEFHDNNCGKDGYGEFVGNELRIVVEARDWWSSTGQYQNWSQ